MWQPGGWDSTIISLSPEDALIFLISPLYFLSVKCFSCEWVVWICNVWLEIVLLCKFLLIISTYHLLKHYLSLTTWWRPCGAGSSSFLFELFELSLFLDLILPGAGAGAICAARVSVYVDICNIDVMVRRLWAWRDGAEYTLSLVELSSFALKHLVGSHINTQLGMFPAVSCRRHNEVLFVTVYGLVRVCGTKYIHRISSLTAVSSCSGRLF